MKTYRKIVSVLLIAAIVTSYAGINLYHHVCSTSGVHIISAFAEETCGHEQLESSCCSTHESVSCCEESKNEKALCFDETDCCTTNTENKVIKEPFVLPDFSIPIFIAPISISFDDENNDAFSLNSYKLLIDKALDGNVFRDNPIVRFIRTITNFGDPDASVNL